MLEKYNNIDLFIKDINKLRLDNTKNKYVKSWYFYTWIFNNKHIAIKWYWTWLQIFRINNIDHSNNMDQKINDFKKHIKKSLI